MMRRDRRAQGLVPVPEWVGDAWTVVAPLGLLYLVTAIASGVSSSARVDLGYMMVNLVIVVALSIFVSNSGVLSFGHLAFVAIGAWTMSLLTIPVEMKDSIMPALLPVLRDASLPPLAAVLVAAVVGGIVALIAGAALMRLHGLEAGIATFALLMLVVQVLTYSTVLGPRSGQSMVGIPQALDLQSMLVIALLVVVAAWFYSRSRSARLLRASRDDITAAPASGIDVTRHRIIAFAISGAVAAVGGALWAQTNRVVQASQFNLDFTFTTIAMLVIGGMFSLWGAVVGVIVVSVLNHVLGLLESGMQLGGVIVSLPSGSRLIIVGLVLIVVLILRPGGLTGGREARWPLRPKLALSRSRAS
jgi:branched-chain amino acid transport system permease protein